MEGQGLPIEENTEVHPLPTTPVPQSIGEPPKAPERERGGEPRAPRSFLRGLPWKRILLVIVGVNLVAGVALGAFQTYRSIRAERSILSLLPVDTEYFARITIDKNHPQVQMADELVRRFPGADKIREVIEPFFIEILRQPLDPFEPIFSLADKEIFLAKISERKEGTGLDQLVNIIEVVDENAIAQAGQSLKDDEGIVVDSYKYEDKTINHAILAELENTQFEQYLGPIPYQMTIPFSKEAYFTDFDNFLVSADKKSDIEAIVSLVKNQTSGLLRSVTKGSILEDSSYQALAGRLSDEYLLQFYQKQKAILNVTQFPGEFGSGFISADSFNRYTASVIDSLLGGEEKKEENIYDVKIGRAFNLFAQSEGIDFSVIQEQLPLSLGDLWSARKLVFAYEDSLAYKFPKKIDDEKIAVWFEIHNIAGQIEFAQNMLTELIEKAPDEETKRVYEQQKEAIDEFFDVILEALFNGKVSREELLGILEGRSVFYLAPRFGGEAPIWGFMLQTENIKRAEEIFGKISYETSSYIDPTDYRRQADLRQIAIGLEFYYDTNSRYPKTLEDQTPDMMLNIPKDPETGDSYRYSTFDGAQKYIIEATLSEGTKISATESLSPQLPPAQRIVVQPAVEEAYKEATIHKLDLSRGQADSELALFWIVGPDMLLFSGELATLKEIYDFYVEGDKSLSLGDGNAFKFQKSRTPADVLMLSYIKPEGFWGLAEYFFAQGGLWGGSGLNLSELAGEELTFVIQSYLKTMNHLFLSVSGDQNVLESSLFFKIEELPQAEKEQAEKYIDDLLEERITPASAPMSPAEERNSARIGDLRQMQLVLEGYYDDHDGYPVVAGSIRISSPLEGDAEDFEKLLVPTYIPALPLDPSATEGFYYEYISLSGGQDYRLTARLEEPYDDELCDRTITESICIFSVRP